MPTLSPLQREVAALLADGMSVSAAASDKGVNERTVYRWQKLEDFQREVNDRRSSRKASEQVHHAKARAARGGFDLDEAIASLRKAKASDLDTARSLSDKLLTRVTDRIEELSADEISVRDLPTLIRSICDLRKWATESESENLEIDQLIEIKLGPDSLVAQKVEIESDAAVERIFQAIALSQDIPVEHKQTIYQLLGGDG